MRADRPRRLSRAELAPQARERILNAAAALVGKHGYAGTTTRKIAEEAGISEGAIYLYFESRQAIFDQLLPHAGGAMMSFIRDRIAGSKDLFEVEERGFRAFFEFSSSNGGFFRILNEAEVSAPAAHRQHFQTLTSVYRRALERGVREGSIRSYDAEELEVVIYMLMGSRVYLHIRFMKDIVPGEGISEKVVSTYMKLLRGGLR